MSQSSHAFLRQNLNDLDNDNPNDKVNDLYNQQKDEVVQNIKANKNKRVVFGDIEVRSSNAAFSSDQMKKNVRNKNQQNQLKQNNKKSNKNNIFNQDSDKSNPFNHDSSDSLKNQQENKQRQQSQKFSPFNRQPQRLNPFNQQLQSQKLNPFNKQSSKANPFNFNKQSIELSSQFRQQSRQENNNINPFKRTQSKKFPSMESQSKFGQTSNQFNMQNKQSQQIMFKNKLSDINGFQGVQGNLQFSQTASKNSNSNTSQITDRIIQQRVRENNQLIQLLDNFYDQSYFLQKSRMSKISKSKIISKNSIPTIQKLNLPYIKRKRIVFRKKQSSLQSTSGLSGNFLCRLNKKTSTIYYKEVKIDQIQNAKTSDCQFIRIKKQAQDLSPDIEIDSINLRVFCFCNKTQSILIYSLSTKQIICRIKVLKKRINPILYLFSINKKNILMIIGGYKSYDNNSNLQGCKYIEIYSFDKWTFNLKPNIIKLIIGRIYPIVIPVIDRNQAKLFIVGGHTNAVLKKDGQIQFTSKKDINSSINRTGFCITSKQILDCLQQENEVKISNSLSIQIDDSMNLYSGFAQISKNQSTVFLPNSRHVYRIKIINKQINIVKNEYKFYLQSVCSSYHSVSFKRFKINQHQTFIYQINQQGIFDKLCIKSKIQEQNRCHCQLI